MIDGKVHSVPFDLKALIWFLINEDTTSTSEIEEIIHFMLIFLHMNLLIWMTGDIMCLLMFKNLNNI